MTTLAIADGLMLLAGVARGQSDALQPPAGATLILRARAQGDQIYTCQQNAYTFSWVFKAPEARLFDDGGRLIGRHFAGPAWQLSDSSQVIARPVALANAPDPGAIPWLLLRPVAQTGHGLLTGVSAVRRLNTHGGKAPPGGCDAAHLGTDTRVPYTADYEFYRS